MNSGILSVLSLQDIDVQILELTKKCEAVPLVLQSFDNDLKVAEKQSFECKSEVKSLESKFNEKEHEETAARQRINKLKSTLETVRLPSEYEQINLEIEKVEAQVDKIDEEGLEFLEGLEAAKNQLDLSIENVKNVKEQVAIKSKDVHGRLKEFKSNLVKLAGKREEAQKQVPEELISIYNRLRVSPKRAGVVCVGLNEKLQCGFCHVKNSPERRIQLLNNQIVLCENCSSLLYLEK